MTKQELYVYIAAILTTLLETDAPAPESSLYLAMGMDLPRYELVRDLMVRLELVTVKSYTMRLTEKGTSMAHECNAALTK